MRPRRSRPGDRDGQAGRSVAANPEVHFASWHVPTVTEWLTTHIDHHVGAVARGHAGDGNVHLAVFCGDGDVRHRLLDDIFAAAMELGGAISGEHGLGRIKMRHFLELEDPVKIALMRRIKDAFDPAGVLNPGALLDGKATQ